MTKVTKTTNYFLCIYAVKKAVQPPFNFILILGAIFPFKCNIKVQLKRKGNYTFNMIALYESVEKTRCKKICKLYRIIIT